MQNIIRCFPTGILKVNTYIVQITSTSAFIVDPAGAKEFSDAQFVLNYLQEKKLTPVAIFLTHAHFDHITGLKDICNSYPNIPIAIHAQDFNEMAHQPGPMNMFAINFFDIEGLSLLLQSQPKPTVKLVNNDTLDIINNNLQEDVSVALAKWKVIHTPGHTPGSCCFYNSEEKLLISGDTLFYGSYGRTDMVGGDEKQMQKSLNLLYKSIPKGTKVYPGHDYFGFEL